MLKFKNPTIWLAEIISAFNSRTRFFQTCGFNRIIKVVMVHDLNPKNLFLGCFGHYPQNEMFCQKYDSIRFLPSRHPNFMRSFRKILSAVLSKRVYLLTYWHTDTLRVAKSKSPFTPRGRGQISYKYFPIKDVITNYRRNNMVKACIKC